MNFQDRSLVQKVLVQSDLEEVRKLTSSCDQYEGLDYLIPNPQMRATLCYENGRLVGLLAIQLGIGEAELYLVVHPEKRRRGIGSTLLQTAKEECERQRIGKCMLVCQESSKSGKAFVESTGYPYQFSEYRMKLDGNRPLEQVSNQSAIRLRQASPVDAKLLAHVTAESFGDTEKGHLERYTQDLPKPTHRFYIAALDDQPIGSIGTNQTGVRVYVVAFGIIPEYRRKGYGRQILSQTVKKLLEEGHQEVLIEVVTDNRNALSLYRSCGFKEQAEYAYYTVRL